MKIAVNAGSLSDEALNLMIQLASAHSRENFLFIYQDRILQKPEFPGNVKVVIKESKKESAFSEKLWYEFTIPRLLKKENADIFISSGPVSLRSKAPQVLLFPDLSSFFQPDLPDKKRLPALKKQTTAYLHKAEKIILASAFYKNQLSSKYNIPAEKMVILPPVIEGKTVFPDFEKKQAIKKKYADGNEYFLFFGSISPSQNLVNILKAFSFFKKRQRSEMKLLIAGKPGKNYNDFTDSLRLYKWNKEVRVYDNLSNQEAEEVISAAYAMVYVPVYESGISHALHAMKFAVPVILSSTGAFNEFFSDAALYVHPLNFKDIAEKMMLLFKDELLRKDLSEQLRLAKEMFTGNDTEKILFESLQELWEKRKAIP